MKRLSTLVLGAASLLTGCNTLVSTEDPAPGCDTPATIQFPICNVLHCPDHPTLLLLNDGTQLRPYGSEWDNFYNSLGNNTPDQVKISYTPEATPAVYSWLNASITCISTVAE